MINVLIALTLACVLMVFVAALYFRVLKPIDDATMPLGVVGLALNIVPLALSVVCYVYDMFFNITVGTLLFLQLPPIVAGKKWYLSLTFSDRLQANIDRCDFETWRDRLSVRLARLTNWICGFSHIKGHYD